MISNSGECKINITELNFNGILQDFPKGKVAILITVNFENEVPLAKVKQDLKELINNIGGN